MRAPLRRWLLALSLALASPSAWAPAALASDVADEAELHFQIGRELYEKVDYRGALEHFLASNRLSPNPKVLFNVARCHEHLGRFPDAFRAFVQARDGADASLERQIDEALSRIAPQVAILDVRTEPAGATLYLDRKELGARGATPRLLGLATGRYRVIAELPGYATATSDELAVTEGTRTTVTLKLEPLVATVNVKADDASAQGAEVRVDRDDGAFACLAPCALSIPPGKHALHLRRAGFKPLELPLDLGPREQRDVRPQLVVLTSSVVVDADVRDSLIEIDGKPYGFTPAVLQVPAGPHVVRVSRAGYRAVERRIVVDAKADQRLDLQLIEAQEVTAASRSAETVDEARASVSIVPGVELRAMGYPTIAEALRGVRGVGVTDDRAYTTLGIRGFGRLGDYGSRVLVTVDGHPMNDDYVGSAFVGFDARVDLEDVERIEVVRGPGSALYGTAAFLGVVNLVTRGRDAPTHVEAGLSSVEYGVSRARVHATYRPREDLGAWTSLSLAWAPDGRDFTFPELASAANGGRAIGLDGFRAATLSGRAWFRDLTVQWFYTDRDKTLPTAVSETVFGSDATRYRDRRAFVELRWDQRPREGAVLTHRAHANLYAFDETLAYDDAAGHERDRFRGAWIGWEERLALQLGRRARLTIGAEAQRHLQARQYGARDDGAVLIDRDDPFWIGAGYAVLDLAVGDRVQITPALRVDGYSTFGTSANPRLSIVTRPWPGGVVKLFGGRAFRAPSIYELFYVADTQRAAAGLKPEDIWSGELEISQRLSPAVTAIAAAYVNRVERLIVLQGGGSSADPNYYANSESRAQTVGGELEVRRDLRDGFLFSAQVSVQRTRYLDHAERFREVPNSPWILAGARAIVPLLARTLRLSSRLSLVGPAWDRYERVEQPPQLRTRAALLWDLVFGGESERPGFRWSFGVYNLFDARWAAPVSGEHAQRVILQNGRTVYASIGVSL